MTTPLPPNYRDCRRLLVLTEDIVRRFSRYHKYTVGTDLRRRPWASCVPSTRPPRQVQQTGWLRHGTRRREINHFQIFTEITT